ncbi:alkaline phosphatase family protein [Streptomyces sp. DSM 44917]|uniref:Alkaline phosphatase family protein n=1 Tax=Streptomyces boetiae TaxID=3075541 RepID=A0ABU2L7X3_9ACTN|nr:alkaline phosphatase family protein [Streptomyces sp. DSM 44917]MDT0307393.1 alkaline phosphatase family protein [Streptomyces sp. DSM 44917]
MTGKRPAATARKASQGRPRPLLVLNVAALTPRLLRHMPRLAAAGRAVPLDPVFPALTCTVQASLLTGLAPREHGIVGNGWYFRELGEILLWRQHAGLVRGERVWEAARRRFPGYRAANLCWWYAMGAGTDLTVTPRPVYHADGRKSPDCYTTPPALHDELTERLGPFPLFQYWGPGAGIASSEWIAHATTHVLNSARPDLTLAYLPHLDYDLQRFGPDDPRAAAAAAHLDLIVGPLLDAARERGVAVVVLSEYGVTAVQRPVHVNRALRAAGWLSVYAQAGMEYLDPWRSRAFAVADHQVAHVYVRRPGDVAAVRELLAGLPGVAEVLDAKGKAAAGLDHERSGELVAVAEADAWFTYYYWQDDARAPDFARCVDIHRKPGYDPAELFLDPGDPLVRVRAGVAAARGRLGLRTAFPVVPLEAAWVRGSHGRLPERPEDGPLLILPTLADDEPQDRYHATEVPSLLLRLAATPQAAMVSAPAVPSGPTPVGTAPAGTPPAATAPAGTAPAAPSAAPTGATPTDR